MLIFVLSRALASPPTYVEASALFTGGSFDYSETPWRLDEGPPGAAAVLEPFGREPFDGVLALGNRVDARLVIGGVRMGVGYGLPVHSFDMADTTGPGRLKATARGVEARELRLSLGGEYFVGDDRPTALYADLVGRHVWADADLSLDGLPASYQAHAYGYSLAGGAKIGFAPMAFVDVGGEVGLVGPVTWSAHVGVGVAIGPWLWENDD